MVDSINEAIAQPESTKKALGSSVINFSKIKDKKVLTKNLKMDSTKLFL